MFGLCYYTVHVTAFCLGGGGVFSGHCVCNV